MALVNVKYRVHCTEYEKGWGSRPWSRDFDTRVEAEEFKDRVNGQNTLDYVPDEYDVAETIEMVEVPDDGE